MIKSELPALQAPPVDVQTGKRKKNRTKTEEPTKKTITAPGLSTTRTAQACDRCRAKKQKCDGRVPACLSCAAIGIKCIVLDKLSRRAFPKGYTETLEERVRQLELENTKLQGLLDLRDEQLALNTISGQRALLESPDNAFTTSVTSDPLTATGTDSNATSVLHTHHHDAGCACCNNPHAVHDRPVSLAGTVYDRGNVSIAGSVFSDDDDRSSILSEPPAPPDYPASFRRTYANGEVSPAPGAFAAATAIEQMQKKGEADEEGKLRILTGLVAASIPRSTEETLFIPTLLARICQVYGYGSRAAIITANAIASLKENAHVAMRENSPCLIPQMALVMDRSTKLKHTELVQFLAMLRLPHKMELDHLVTMYFQNWGNVCPIVSKASFLENYVRLTEVLHNLASAALLDAAPEDSYELIEKLGAVMVLVVALALISNKFAIIASKDNTELKEYLSRLNHYDALIHEFVKPTCSLTRHCLLLSLQILALALQYCLAMGDVTACYDLRARVITMAQQLRLHRCPAAVLGLGKDPTNVHLQNFMQGDRRILFWCIYCLDTYASLSLGIPRLFKDHEIECALPFSGNGDDYERDNENILIINNTRLTIFGKVSKIALTTMQYCKVLGNILDLIFLRSGGYDVQAKALEKDRILDCWRRDLPSELKFDIDVNGFSLKDASNNKLNGGGDVTNWAVYSKQQLMLIFLYYHAKILIYLPIILKYGYHHNVGISVKEKLSMGQRDVSTVVSSMTMIHQSSMQILEVLKCVANMSHLLPIPVNIPREQARFALLVAKGSLDYMKGGPLHLSLKQLLLDTLAQFKAETEKNIPGGLTRNSLTLLEYATWSILGLNLASRNTTNLRKQIFSNQPFMKMPAEKPTETLSLTTRNVQVLEKEQTHIFQNQIFPPVQIDQVVNQKNEIPDWQPPPSIHNFEADHNVVKQEDLNDNILGNPEAGLSDLDAGFDDILKFDPFKMNYSNEILANEFVADGSLGLVPFLNETSEAYANEDDRLSDRMDDDGAFSFNW